MPAYTIPRKPIPFANEPYWVKFQAPHSGESPATPDAVTPNVLISRELLKGLNIRMHDGVQVKFFTIGSPNFPNGRYPGETFRVTQGQVLHANVKTSGGTHTLHWHGIEPTPMNDGVGHPSFELGEYTYQWQPNFPGTYFFHCHKNTVLHFEMGLYGMMIFDPKDKGPGWVSANVPGWPGFDAATYTLPYDVEAAWVLDDVDPVWHEESASAYEAGSNVNGPYTFDGIFNFFVPQYFFVSGYQVPAPRFGAGSVPAGLRIGDLTEEQGDDAAVQIAVNARVNQTALVRIINAAYWRTRITMNGIAAKTISHDGRSLGVPPYGAYNTPYDIPAGGSFMLTTAERQDLLIRSDTPGNFSATVEYLNVQFAERVEFTVTIPITITA